MDERKFARLESIASLSALMAWEISTRDILLPFGDLRGYRDDWPPYRHPRKRTADPVKKAARKRQRKARAVNRRKK